MKHTIALATLLSSSSVRGATAFRSAVGGGAAAINVNRSSSATAGGVDRTVGRGATRVFSVSFIIAIVLTVMHCLLVSHDITSLALHVASLT